jgi:peptidyl-prolyl cis-trans isomerase B (cyclophilin B)
MGTTNQRQRELARAKEARRQARLAQEQARKARRKRTAIIAGLVAVLLAVGGYVLLATLGSDEEQPLAEEPQGGAATDTDAGSAGGPQPVEGCVQPGELTDASKQFDAPEQVLGGATAATITFQTNCGDIVVTADAAAAPQTVNAMAFLTQQEYFDNTLCHRLVTSGIFVLQCGDPTASGSGGPGFSVPDENLPAQAENNYPAGTVAMANAGPNTSGSQFFLVYQDTTLGPNYTVWGQVTEGLDIVQRIAAAGTTDGGSDGAPAQATMIQRATVELS